MGVAPTGRQMTFSGMIFPRLADDKIVEWWNTGTRWG
jgi:predicted ester cyclase